MSLPTEDKNQQTSQVPEFMQEDAGVGYDDVDDQLTFEEWRIITPLSNMQGEVGNVYNYTTSEDLGAARKFIIFAKRKTFFLSDEENTALLCKSHDRKKGYIRAYQGADAFDKEAMEGLGVTVEEIEGAESILERECDTCPHHPVKGWSTDAETGDNIPPRCNVSHDYYILDFEDEVVDPSPKLIRIGETSRLKRDVASEFDNLISSKLRMSNVPLYGGVFEMTSQDMENSRGKNVTMPDFNFVGILAKGLDPKSDRFRAHKEAYNVAKTSAQEFNDREEELAQAAEKSAVADGPAEHEEVETEDGDFGEDSWDLED